MKGVIPISPGLGRQLKGHLFGKHEHVTSDMRRHRKNTHSLATNLQWTFSIAVELTNGNMGSGISYHLKVFNQYFNM